MNVHQKIKAARVKREMTHQQFADAVGVSRGAVQHWEKGTTAPKRNNQPAVAKFMGLSIAELMEDTDAPSAPHLPENRPLFYAPNVPHAGGGLSEAIETIAQALALLTDAEREAVTGKINMLAHAPDSAQLKQSIAHALGMVGTAFAQSSKKIA